METQQLSARMVFSLLGAPEPLPPEQCSDLICRSDFPVRTRQSTQLAKALVRLLGEYPLETGSGLPHRAAAEPQDAARKDVVRNIEEFMRGGVPVDTVVYDQCDPVLGILVAQNISAVRGDVNGTCFAAVPNLFSRNPRLASFAPRHEAFIKGRRVLIVARQVTAGIGIANCARVCRELGAARVYIAAIANFGQSELQCSSDAIRSLLLF